jgi:hypothetical protein
METHYRFRSQWQSKLTVGTPYRNEALSKIQQEAVLTEGLVNDIIERYCSTLPTLYGRRTPVEVATSTALLKEVMRGQGDRAKGLFEVSETTCFLRVAVYCLMLLCTQCSL